MISVVCWKWRGWDPERQFGAPHVNVLRAMVARHLPQPHRFICITDDPHGLDPRIEVVPMPAQTFAALRSPHGPRFPSCYRRLWVFSEEAKRVLGERVLCIDIDVVICAPLAPLIDREEPFVGWCDARFAWNKIAGGVYLLRTGALSYVWDDFHPERSPELARAAGCGGSDQGWMSFRIYPPPGRWRPEDGLVKIGWTPHHATQAPPGARIVFTSGRNPPWSPDTQRRYPWITKHWAL